MVVQVGANPGSNERQEEDNGYSGKALDDLLQGTHFDMYPFVHLGKSADRLWVF